MNQQESMTDVDRSEIRGILLQKKATILERLDHILKDKMRLDGPLDKDLEDQAVSIENDEVLDALDEHSRKELGLIDVTLRKMDTGEYGICANCGGYIGRPRLKALPYALKCILCAS